MALKRLKLHQTTLIFRCWQVMCKVGIPLSLYFGFSILLLFSRLVPDWRITWNEVQSYIFFVSDSGFFFKENVRYPYGPV